MAKRTAIYFILAAGLSVLCSCSVTRRVPEGGRLLTRNIVEEDRSTPRKERIRTGEVEKLIQPQPNRRVLGMNLYLQLYNMANPDTTRQGWFNRTLRRMGDPPVLLDSTMVKYSADVIRNYSAYAGFYNSEVTFSVDTSRRRKAAVTYSIEQKKPYRIGEIKYVFRDEFLRPIIIQDSAATLLHSGEILSGTVLSSERVRIVNNLKENGYYDFSLTNIEFIGDTLSGGHIADLTVVFKQHLAGYTPQGAPIYENNSIYRIDRITLNPDYDPVKEASDTAYYTVMDTLSYRGLDILYPTHGKPKVRPRILRRAVNLYPNYLYRASDVRQAYSNIMRLGYYKNASILFRPSETADTTAHNEVSYIGDGNEEGSLETTTEKYLSCNINCIPALRQSYKIDLEGTTSSNFNAINATIGYQNRNLLRGVELFDISVKGGYEFMRSKSSNTKTSFEIGGATSLSFPRFVAPWNVDPYNRRVNPRTKLELSISTQRRPVYHRTLSGVNWGYSWSNSHNSSYTLRPIDVNLIKLSYLDEEFMNGLNNEYLRNSFRSQLVAGLSGSFVYNTQATSQSLGEKSFLFRLNFETAGNLINLISRALSHPVKEGEGDQQQEYYRILGIRYAQYFRTDASVSDRIILGPKTSIAWRLYTGIGLSYGNANSIPFDRLFYAGGSNSMRGWVTRSLGPGNVTIANEQYPSQVGNMKLEANAEVRFPVWGMLNGALFFDLGNIWFLGEGTSNKAGVFRFDRFYRQLGFNTGLGFRFDIGMAILRLDWGIRIHDPNMERGERWIGDFGLRNTVLNFGVGYPF